MDFLLYKFDTIGICLATSFIVLLIIQVLYYFIVYAKVSFYKKKETRNDNYPSVSVVICIKDEAINMEKKLPIILEQMYPNFEVIVVNDASEDESYYILQVLQEIYPHLKVVNLFDNINSFIGKKFPLSLGIKSAKNDIIIVTDPDCLPNSLDWITKMVQGFTKGKEIVLGYSSMEKNNTFVNSLMHYENQTLSMNYLGYALLGSPYMGVGRNLAYKRELFFSQGGFISHYNIPTGEDDLFVNKIANHKNTSVVLDKDAFVISSAKKRYSDWIEQKRKYYCSLKHFKLKDKFLTSILPFTTFLLYCLLAVSIVLGFPWQYVLGILIIKYTVQIICYYRSAKLLNTKKKNAIFAPIYELYFLFFNTFVRIGAKFSKKNKWK